MLTYKPCKIIHLKNIDSFKSPSHKVYRGGTEGGRKEKEWEREREKERIVLNLLVHSPDDLNDGTGPVRRQKLHLGLSQQYRGPSIWPSFIFPGL